MESGIDSAASAADTAPDDGMQICDHCGGLGQVRIYPRGVGFLIAKAWDWVECGECDGWGYVWPIGGAQ